MRQLKREVDCALKLVALLQPYVDGDADGFRTKLQREVRVRVRVRFRVRERRLRRRDQGAAAQLRSPSSLP